MYENSHEVGHTSVSVECLFSFRRCTQPTLNLLLLHRGFVSAIPLKAGRTSISVECLFSMPLMRVSISPEGRSHFDIGRVIILNAPHARSGGGGGGRIQWSAEVTHTPLLVNRVPVVNLGGFEEWGTCADEVGAVLRTSARPTLIACTILANNEMTPGLKPLFRFISSPRPLTFTTAQWIVENNHSTNVESTYTVHVHICALTLKVSHAGTPDLGGVLVLKDPPARCCRARWRVNWRCGCGAGGSPPRCSRRASAWPPARASTRPLLSST